MAEEIIRSDCAGASVPFEFGGVLKRVSWSAVWAGVMVALGMEALFTLFGMFIGFGMYNWRAANPWAGISSWTTVWYLVTAGWSMFFGAYCAARLSGNPSAGDGILHGITTWGLATVAIIAILTLASWAVFREGIDTLGTAAITITPAPTATNVNSGPMAQATANILSGLSLRGFGGVLLGFITAILGGWVGRSRAVVTVPQEAAPAPTRRAA